jgi:ATP adenylyltransferase
LERLWSPWRAKYIASGGGSGSDSGSCVFCAISLDLENDEKNLVLHRSRYCFVILNLYPYAAGHLLIIPYDHIAELDAAPGETTDEIMNLTKRSQTALREVYSPTGFNLGMNLGVAGGAGIVGHIHMHILPRWIGDTNFMTTIADTRVISEELTTTYSRLKGKF